MVFDSELCGVHIVNLPSMDYKLCDQVSDTVKNKNNLKKNHLFKIMSLQNSAVFPSFTGAIWPSKRVCLLDSNCNYQ